MNGAAGGSGMGSEGDLTPKQQHEQTLEQRNIMSTRASLERFLFKVQKGSES